MVNAPPVMSFGAVKDLTLEEGKGGNGVQTTALYKRPSAPAAQPPLSPILVDSDMPTRARIVTLVSYLTSKMFWPFVGGVMFGLGEAFARNVVGPRFGWPKPVAPSVKIRVVPGGSNRSVTIRKSTDRATGERVSVIQAD
ncbi:hypothetical protein FRC08_017291 [Ceratobasidium sp. 394]|nr:hypothetical protein FRC08_017291 [Ceratobasidium sp. 394]